MPPTALGRPIGERAVRYAGMSRTTLHSGPIFAQHRRQGFDVIADRYANRARKSRLSTLP